MADTFGGLLYLSGLVDKRLEVPSTEAWSDLPSSDSSLPVCNLSHNIADYRRSRGCVPQPAAHLCMTLLDRTLNQPQCEGVDAIMLRPVVEDDRPFLLSLFSSTRTRELGLAALAPVQLEEMLSIQFTAQRESYRAQFPDASDQIVLIGGERAGRMLVHGSETEIRLVDISLCPEYRNRGIGSSLVKGLQRVAARAKLPLALHVAVTNPAVMLYLRLGFVVTGNTGSHYRMEWRAEAASWQK
jgi:GNAT superfamily N-acetyltransferase